MPDCNGETDLNGKMTSEFRGIFFDENSVHIFNF